MQGMCMGVAHREHFISLHLVCPCLDKTQSEASRDVLKGNEMSSISCAAQVEAEPILMQAVRYHTWQDPGPQPQLVSYALARA